MLPNVYQAKVAEELIERIHQLSPTSTPTWGKMTVAQMLAHCSVTYALAFTPERFKQPNFLKKWLLKSFVKKMVVNEVPYPHNGRTAPEFIIADSRDFEDEKTTLISYIHKVQELGQTYFDGKENISFGKLTATEWNNMFYKHLDHHLRQFGV